MSYSFSAIDSHIDGIRDTTENGVGGIENYAKQRAHREPVDEYEWALVNKSNALESNVHDKVDEIREYVLSRRPRSDDPDYERKRDKFIQFTKHATEGMSGLKGTFNTLFSKVKNVIKRIANWVRENLPNIIQTIGSIFKNIVYPIISIATGGHIQPLITGLYH